jgi:7-cyano-7-deazaguanine tRNA-ribosyltransferase
MENYRFAELTKMIVATRRAVPYAMPLHLFGAGHPLTMALAVALGCDTFDSASYVLFARGGRYMTDRGVSRLETMKYLPCSCPVCSGTTVTELQELERREMVRELSLHNLHVLRKELETCKQAVSEGRLWDLVRERAAAHPRLLEAFHSMAATGSLIEDGTPPLKLKGLLLRDLRDADRPEVVAARRRLHESVRRGSTQAVLVDAEWSVPTGKTGLIAGLPKGADVYRLHPLLGPYPVELEFVYPFTQTVAASSLKETDGLAEAASDLRRLGYRRVYVARQGKGGGLRVRQLRSRRRSKASSPSAPSSSARPR